jgi:anti-sigma regulatory factor (Ser/Thr protein kinase)
MNAMEHGNKYQAQVPVLIRIYSSQTSVSVFITDRGGDRVIPTPETPDLQAKLDGRQSPRGWGLFLIKNLVDEMHATSGERHHTIELVMHLEGGGHDRPSD